MFCLKTSYCELNEIQVKDITERSGKKEVQQLGYMCAPLAKPTSQAHSELANFCRHSPSSIIIIVFSFAATSAIRCAARIDCVTCGIVRARWKRLSTRTESTREHRLRATFTSNTTLRHDFLEQLSLVCPPACVTFAGKI